MHRDYVSLPWGSIYPSWSWWRGYVAQYEAHCGKRLPLETKSSGYNFVAVLAVTAAFLPRADIKWLWPHWDQDPPMQHDRWSWIWTVTWILCHAHDMTRQSGRRRHFRISFQFFDQVTCKKQMFVRTSRAIASTASLTDCPSVDAPLPVVS